MTTTHPILSFYIGDQWVIPGIALDATGNPLNLNETTINWILEDMNGVHLDYATYGNGILIVNAELGQFEIVRTSDVTKKLPPGRCQDFCQSVDPFNAAEMQWTGLITVLDSPFITPTTLQYAWPSLLGGSGELSVDAIVVAQAGANTGQVLINPNFLETSGSYDFLNLFKNAVMPWGQAGDAISPADVDSNGYPTVLTGGALCTTLVFISQIRTPSHYWLTYDGAGSGGLMNVPGVPILSGSYASGSVLLDCTGGADITLQITAVPVTNIKFYHVDDAADMAAGFISGSEIRARIKQAQSPVFRMLNWLGPGFGGANYTNITNWASRKPVSYATYCGDEIRPALFAGITTNSGNDYSCTLGSGAPADKQYVHCYFNAAQTDINTWNGSGSNLTFASGSPGTVNWGATLPASIIAGAPIMFGGFAGFNAPPEIVQFSPYYVKTVTGAQTFTISATNGGTAINFSTNGGSGVVGVRAPTLNMNSTGAVPIWDQTLRIIWGPGGNIIGTNSSGHSSLATLVYDAQINVWTLWGGTSSETAGIGNGVPPEVFIQFCAELGCHPWFCSPPFACDPMTDWHTQLAIYCRDNAPSWMKPRIECLNEPWNFGNTVSGFCNAKSVVNWGAQDVPNEVGKIASTIGQDVSAVYGGTPGTGTRYQLMVNVQTGNVAGDPDMLNSSLYVAQAAAPQSGYIKAAAKNYLTHVAVNQYINSAENESAAAAAWNTATGNSALQQQIIDVYLDGTGSAGGFTGTNSGFPATAGANGDGVLGVQVKYQDAFTFAQGFTNLAGNKIRMCGYEGGVSATQTTSGHQMEFWDDCMKRGTHLQFYCTENYNNFIAAGGEYPALFQFAGASPRDNVWSALIDIYQSPDPPEWSAVVSFA